MRVGSLLRDRDGPDSERGHGILALQGPSKPLAAAQTPDQLSAQASWTRKPRHQTGMVKSLATVAAQRLLAQSARQGLPVRRPRPVGGCGERILISNRVLGRGKGRPPRALRY